MINRINILLDKNDIIKPIINIILEYADIKHPLALCFQKSKFNLLCKELNIHPKQFLKKIQYKKIQIMKF